jgi:DNA invertase Pin-like site-specific DNA recombinase
MSTNTWKNPKIRKEHLCRKALVYLRQSSMKQVIDNRESQRLQYAMANEAQAIGFFETEVVDCDLGVRASIGSERKGFEYVVEEVARGHVGAVVSREVSRLSRTDKDWCHLLELCQVFDTLVMDEERVYDLSEIDDQLMLGIKGTMSVVELKILKMRMQDGKEEKARRGELKMRLPPGYVYDSLDRVVKDPDERVREAIDSVFQKFRELWSARQTFKWFHDNDVSLPANIWGGGHTKLQWKKPSQSFIENVLRNPFYAGAYVYGRRPNKTVFSEGKITRKAGSPIPAEQCRVFIKDHHEGYISWEEFEKNREKLHGNSVRFESDPKVAAVRSGHGLLAGLLRCGHCGRKLHVRYWGKSGTKPRYFCNGTYDTGGDYCISFGGDKIDERFGEEILRAVSAYGVAASFRAIESANAQQETKCRALELELKQLQYEAGRVFEQYDQVDPENRLVAQELENRWNAKMLQVQQAKEALALLTSTHQVITPETEERIRNLGRNFSEVWHDTHCPMELKKKIAHAIIEEVAVKLNRESLMLHFVIHWRGGCHTEYDLPKPRSAKHAKTSMEALSIIRKMSRNYGDDQIAAVLNKSGHRTGKGKRWNLQRVATLRRRHSITGQRTAPKRTEILTLAQASKYCNVSQHTIIRMVEMGLLKNYQEIPFAPWEIMKADINSPKIKSVLNHLKRTGKLIAEGDHLQKQLPLMPENKGNDNGGYYE